MLWIIYLFEHGPYWNRSAYLSCTLTYEAPDRWHTKIRHTPPQVAHHPTLPHLHSTHLRWPFQIKLQTFSVWCSEPALRPCLHQQRGGGKRSHYTRKSRKRKERNVKRGDRRGENERKSRVMALFFSSNQSGHRKYGQSLLSYSVE